MPTLTLASFYVLNEASSSRILRKCLRHAVEEREVHFDILRVHAANKPLSPSNPKDFGIRV